MTKVSSRITMKLVQVHAEANMCHGRVYSRVTVEGSNKLVNSLLVRTLNAVLYSDG